MAKKTIAKKVYQYTAIFEPDKESGGYTVTIPSLPGCISEGDTFEKALENIKYFPRGAWKILGNLPHFTAEPRSGEAQNKEDFSKCSSWLEG